MKHSGTDTQKHAHREKDMCIEGRHRSDVPTSQETPKIASKPPEVERVARDRSFLGTFSGSMALLTL